MSRLKSAVHSLKARLTILMFLGMIIASILVVLGVYKLTLDNAVHDAGHQVNELIDAVEYSAAIALYANNEQIADDVIKGILRGSFVSAVHLFNGATLDLARSKHPHSENTPIIRRTLHSPFDAQEQVGQLEVTLYPEEIHLRASNSAEQMALGLTALALLPSLLFWLVVSRLLSNPLLKLAQQLSKLKPGSEQRLSPIDGRHHDELATLVDNINALLNTVTAYINKERQLRFHIEALEQQYESIFTQASTGIALLDAQGRCLIANPAVSNLFAHWQPPVDSVFSLLTNWENELFFEPDQFRSLLINATSSRSPQSLDLRLLRRSHDQQDWVHVLISCHDHPEQRQVVECLFMDVSIRKQIEDEARFQSQHDPLTLLLNRRGLEARLSLKYGARDNDRGCLLLLDLDRFKQINDHWGHQAGDKVLVEVARRMKAIVRGADLLARLGGDEFLICLREQPGEQALQHFLTRLIDSITRDIELGDSQRDHVGVSIGLALYPEAGGDFDQLLYNADAALYQVKHGGRNGYCIYGEDGLLPVFLARDA